MSLKPAAQQTICELGRRYPVLAGILPEVTAAIEMLCARFSAEGQLLLCGNGGSAADCTHIAGELAKGFLSKRALPAEDIQRLRKTGFPDASELSEKLQRGVRALSLTTPDALNTAFANDVDADLIFAQQVYVYGRPGDVLMGLSTSGNSRNVIAALKVAKAFGLRTVGLTGSTGGAMASLCDVCIKAPAEKTHEIQELHLPVYHAICAAVEAELWD